MRKSRNKRKSNNRKKTIRRKTINRRKFSKKYNRRKSRTKTRKKHKGGSPPNQKSAIEDLERKLSKYKSDIDNKLKPDSRSYKFRPTASEYIFKDGIDKDGNSKQQRMKAALKILEDFGYDPNDYLLHDTIKLYLKYKDNGIEDLMKSYISRESIRYIYEGIISSYYNYNTPTPTIKHIKEATDDSQIEKKRREAALKLVNEFGYDPQSDLIKFIKIYLKYQNKPNIANLMKQGIMLHVIEYIYKDDSKIEERKQAAFELVKFGYNPTSENIEIYLKYQNKPNIVKLMEHKLKLNTIEYIYKGIDDSEMEKRKEAALKLVKSGYNPTSENIEIYLEHQPDIVDLMEHKLKLSTIKYIYEDTDVSKIEKRQTMALDLLNTYQYYLNNSLQKYIEFYINNPKLKDLIPYYIDISLLEKLDTTKIKETIEIINNGPKGDISELSPYHMYRNITKYREIKPTQRITSVNVGPEIETCIPTQSYPLESLEHFKTVDDTSIKCRHMDQRSEFVHTSYQSSNTLSNLNSNLNKITESSWNKDKDTDTLQFVSEKCLDGSCGLHFHISHNDLRINMFGIVFLTILLERWVDEYQEDFIKKFPYQINRVGGKSYSHRNTISAFEKEFLKKIRENVKSKINDTEYHAMPYFYYNSLSGYFSEIRPFLTIVTNSITTSNVDDFIHIEFRGLYPTKDLKETFSNFTTDVIAMYNDVLEKTNEYLEPVPPQTNI